MAPLHLLRCAPLGAKMPWLVDLLYAAIEFKDGESSSIITREDHAVMKALADFASQLLKVLAVDWPGSKAEEYIADTDFVNYKEDFPFSTVAEAAKQP